MAFNESIKARLCAVRCIWLNNSLKLLGCRLGMFINKVPLNTFKIGWKIHVKDEEIA